MSWILFIFIALLAITIYLSQSSDEDYWATTYTMTPRRSGVAYTDVAPSGLWWPYSYIRNPYRHYSALPYF